MKKLKKWQKIVIGVLVALIVVIGGLKIFKRPILSAVLSEDEQFQYDAYCKGKRVLNEIGIDAECYTMNWFYTDLHNNIDRNISMIYSNSDCDIKISSTYEDFDSLGLNFWNSHTSIQQYDETSNDELEEYSGYNIKDINLQGDLFYNSILNEEADIELGIFFDNYISQEKQDILNSENANEMKSRLLKIKILWYIFH